MEVVGSVMFSMLVPTAVIKQNARASGYLDGYLVYFLN